LFHKCADVFKTGDKEKGRGWTRANAAIFFLVLTASFGFYRVQDDAAVLVLGMTGAEGDCE
jgi:hypothetical protein